MNESIIREIASKLSKCPECKRPHRIIHEINVPKEFKDKYQQLSCHLRFHPDHYLGSYVDQGFTWDVYSYPIRWNTIYAGIEELKEEPEPEKRQEPFYGKTPYEKEQLLDEDNYTDW